LTTYTFHAILQFVSHQLPGRDIQALSQAIRGCIPGGSGERLTGSQEVSGSIPLISTKKHQNRMVLMLFSYLFQRKLFARWRRTARKCPFGCRKVAV
jgi:hypothetical protein